MIAVFNSFLTYVIIFLALAAVAGFGIFLGKKLRDAKDAKK